MKICLKTTASYMEPSQGQVKLDTRLPNWIQSPCDLSCTYDATAYGGYYLINLSVDGVLPITCQRCLEPVSYSYHHETQLAVCSNEKQALRLMESFECVMSAEGELNLVDVLTDDLYLNSPEIPHELADCHLDLSLFT